MSEIRDKVREELKGHCRSMLTASAYNQLDDVEFDGRIKEMLKIEGLAIVDREAELPVPEYMFLDGHSTTRHITQNAFATSVSKDTQQKMLKAGYVKEAK